MGFPHLEQTRTSIQELSDQPDISCAISAASIRCVIGRRAHAESANVVAHDMQRRVTCCS
jgi:hypothetical protein